MQEHIYVSRSSIVAVVWWSLVAAFIGAGWLIIALQPSAWRWAGASIGTGCATSAVAATMHIRLYVMRTCGLIRAAHGLDMPTQRKGLESIR